MAQWWKHSPPPSDVARVQILASTPREGWLSLLLVLSFAPRVFFFGYFGFPLSFKKTTFSNSNSTRNQRRRYRIEYFQNYALACFLNFESISSPDWFYEKSLSLVVIDWTVLKSFNFLGEIQKHPPPPPPLTPPVWIRGKNIKRKIQTNVKR